MLPPSHAAVGQQGLRALERGRHFRRSVVASGLPSGRASGPEATTDRPAPAPGAGIFRGRAERGRVFRQHGNKRRPAQVRRHAGDAVGIVTPWAETRLAPAGLGSGADCAARPTRARSRAATRGNRPSDDLSMDHEHGRER